VLKTNSMKKVLVSICILAALNVFAQVPKKVLVEHFTNTLCSVCAPRNPSFRTNLNNQNDVVYISYHPSSPYSACIFNKENKTGNDNRTIQYGLFGSTPRIAINGIAINGNTNYGTQAMFDPHIGQSSPFELKVTQFKGTNELRIKVIIIKRDTGFIGNTGTIYIAAAEDTIFYNAPNGETSHYRVFRESATSALGDIVNLPSNLGDSLVSTYNIPLKSNWNQARMETVVVLGDKNKNYLQSAATKATDSDQTLSAQAIEKQEFSVYPNPCKDYLNIQSEQLSDISKISVFDVTGKEIRSISYNEGVLETKALKPGFYFIKIDSEGLQITLRFIKD
jgi:mRNA-degrading endonuclease HigB of HigAB toxin-antitoxin module